MVVLTIAHALLMPRGVSDMTEPEAESNAAAAVLKRVLIYFTEHNLIVFHQLHNLSIHSALTLIHCACAKQYAVRHLGH